MLVGLPDLRRETVETHLPFSREDFPSGADSGRVYLIQVNGLLIAFTGIIFTGMLAEVRFRTERALQATDQKHVERLDRTSKALRKSAFGSFLFFSASLGDAIGNLAAALASTPSLTSMAGAFVLPVMLMIGGLALLMVALALIALE